MGCGLCAPPRRADRNNARDEAKNAVQASTDRSCVLGRFAGRVSESSSQRVRQEAAERGVTVCWGKTSFSDARSRFKRGPFRSAASHRTARRPLGTNSRRYPAFAASRGLSQR